MKRTTKNGLLIACLSILVLVIGGVVAFRFTVDRMFLKVTQNIGEHGLLLTASENEEYNRGEVLIPSVDSPEGGKKVRLDAAAVEKLQDKVPVSDKLAVMSLLAKALPQEEYKRLFSFLTNGVSQEEMSSAMDVLRQYLSEEKKQEIKQYYTKYIHLLEE